MSTLDLGSGFTAEYFTRNGERAGIIVTGPAAPQCKYPTNEAGLCGGGVHFEGHQPEGRPGWTVESEDPLTLSPSIQCGCGGQHGHIQQGRWVPA